MASINCQLGIPGKREPDEKLCPSGWPASKSVVWRSKNVSLFPLLTKGQRIGTYLYSFKVIVFLPQAKVPPRFGAESSAFTRLLSTGVSNSQTLYFRNREVDMFLPQTKV